MKPAKQKTFTNMSASEKKALVIEILSSLGCTSVGRLVNCINQHCSTNNGIRGNIGAGSTRLQATLNSLARAGVIQIPDYVGQFGYDESAKIQLSNHK